MNALAALRGARLLPLLAVLAAVGGCAAADMDDLRDYAEQIKARKGRPIEPLPEIKPYDTYAYQAQELRDPFGMPVTAEVAAEEGPAAGSGVRPDPNRPREPLEAYPLDSLRMVGTLERNQQVWAIVRGGDGTIYRIQEGNYMGRNHGKITRISGQEIELTEIVPDGSGGWLERPATLALNEE